MSQVGIVQIVYFTLIPYFNFNALISTNLSVFRLQYLFVGLEKVEMAAVKQFQLKALALHLVYIVRASNLSALALCEHFLNRVELTQK